MYWYVFNDREMADVIMKVTGEPYRIYDRENGDKVYSFKKTDRVLIAYNSFNEAKKLLQVC